MAYLVQRQHGSCLSIPVKAVDASCVLADAPERAVRQAEQVADQDLVDNLVADEHNDLTIMTAHQFVEAPAHTLAYVRQVLSSRDLDEMRCGAPLSVQLRPAGSDEVELWFSGAASGWVNAPPWAELGTFVWGESPSQFVIEMAITPWDDLHGDGPESSRRSGLYPGKIIGFQLSVPDWDVAGTYHAFHTLTGQAKTWQLAERFADARLVGGGGTAVESNSWARIKASVSE